MPAFLGALVFGLIEAAYLIMTRKDRSFAASARKVATALAVWTGLAIFGGLIWTYSGRLQW